MATSAVTTSSRFPSTSEIKEAMVTAGTTIEGADYLVNRVKALADNSKFMSKHPELRDNVIAAVEKFAEYVTFKLTSNAQPWSAQQPETSDFKNMQKNMAEAATEKLGGRLADVKIYYDVSDQGQYTRAYRSSKGALDDNETEVLDNQFSSWLATKGEHGYVVKGGYLYDSSTKNFNEDERLSEAQVKEMLADGSLTQHLEKELVDSVSLQHYSGAQKEARVKQDVEAAIEQIAAVETRVTAAPSSATAAESVSDAEPQEGASFSG